VAKGALRWPRAVVVCFGGVCRRLLRALFGQLGRRVFRVVVLGAAVDAAVDQQRHDEDQTLVEGAAGGRRGAHRTAAGAGKVTSACQSVSPSAGSIRT